ncbi:MAG: glycosyltransferase [Burkholderiales bacterium]|nr:glycosyltransferase [Burkholderiales bacterium]
MSPDHFPSLGPTFTVLLCANRSTPFLRESIDSVLKQDDGDFEFLIAANACPDELVEELRCLIGLDPRARIIRTEIGQLAFNLNLLASEARGDYLVRMDADDISLPNRISRLRRSLTENPVDVLGSWAYVIDEAGNRTGEYRLPLEHRNIVHRLPYGTVFCHPSVALRKQFLIDMRGYLGGFASEDTDLWLRGARRGAKYMNLPECLLSYRVHPGQSSRSRQSYAETASHWLRELLASPDGFVLKGFSVAFAKCLLSPLLRASRRPKRAGVRR